MLLSLQNLGFAADNASVIADKARGDVKLT